MALVAFDGTPLVPIGAAGHEGSPFLSGASTVGTMDATNEAVIFIGQVYTEDGGSHTIDTSGSSSIGWKSEAVTFADGSTTMKVGIAAVDTATGPAPRAANTTNVINFDVSKTHTGGGGTVTANAWQENVPDTGTKTIAHGDLVAVAIQITNRAGADSVVAHTTFNNVSGSARPNVTVYQSSTYTNANAAPNCVITFSDGTYGFLFGGHVFSTATTTQTWNNTSGTKEYGNYLLMPMPAKIYGIIANASLGGNADVILYSDPLGTPVAEKTVSVDLNTIGIAAVDRYAVHLFSSPYSSKARQPLAAILKPTSATNISSYYKTFNVAGHQKSESLGANGYAVNRNAGAFAAQNSNKDRFAIGLLVGAFEHPALANYVLGI